MSIKLRWITSPSASALHTTEALLTKRKIADPVAATLEAPSRRLAAAIERCNQSPGRLLELLIPLSRGILQPRHLAEVALTKVLSRDQAMAHAPPLAEALRQLFSAFERTTPDALEQLSLRAQPLRAQWEARGPGLVAELARLVDDDLIVAQADVILVQPLLGGHGRAYLPYNTVLIEAVLTDASAALPEVLRLAWLVAQLQCELPKFQCDLTRDQLARVASLAMVPAVLASAEEVELARCDESTLKLAIDSWRVSPAGSQSDLSKTVQDWWTTYINARPPWSVALGALEKMVRA